MSSDHAAEIDKHVKVYIGVFVALLILTVVTVGVFYIHLSVPKAIALALAIATVKASLVACFFMHLKTEKAWIFITLAITFAFFLVLLFLPVLTKLDAVG
jgi:cytochrome c oxidase subunit 4